jgi:hypothetical protein
MACHGEDYADVDGHYNRRVGNCVDLATQHTPSLFVTLHLPRAMLAKPNKLPVKSRNESNEVHGVDSFSKLRDWHRRKSKHHDGYFNSLFLRHHIDFFNVTFCLHSLSKLVAVVVRNF